MRGIKWTLGVASFVLLGGLALVSPASAQNAKGPLFYKPMPVMGSGYSDKRRAENRWWVRGFSGSSNLALNLAIYRGALLMKAMGYSHFMIVDGRIMETRSLYVSNGNAEFTIVGAHSGSEVIPCEAKPKYARNCRMLDVDLTIGEAGPMVFRNAEQRAGDLADAQAYVEKAKVVPR